MIEVSELLKYFEIEEITKLPLKILCKSINSIPLLINGERSLVRAFASISVRLLTEHHLECLRLKGGCTGSSESTHVQMVHCWKSHVAAQIIYLASGKQKVQLKTKTLI